MFLFVLLFIFISLLFNGIAVYYPNVPAELFSYVVLPMVLFKIILNISKNDHYSKRAIINFVLIFLSVLISSIVSSFAFSKNFSIWVSVKSALSFVLWPSIFLLVYTERFDVYKLNITIKLIKFFGYVLAFNTLLPIFAYYFGGVLIGELVIEAGKLRSFGFFSDQVAYSLVYYFLLALYERKILNILLFALSVLVTGTRGAIFISLIAIFIYFVQLLYSKRYSAKHFIYQITLFVFVIGFLLSIEALEFISDFLALRMDNDSVLRTSNQRLGAINAAWNLWLQNPIFGVGYGNFADIVYSNSQLLSYFDYSVVSPDAKRGFANAQNQWLDLAVNFGLINVILVFLFLYNLLEKLYIIVKKYKNFVFFKVVFTYIILLLFFHQYAIYMFNYGINSFLFLIFLGLANMEDFYLNSFVIKNVQKGYSLI